MRFVNPNDGGLAWPGASVNNTHSSDGVLLDTGWLVNWPGPGYVYLADGDIIDVVIPAAKERPAVQEALKSAGWTEPGKTHDHVAALEQKLTELGDELANAKAAEEGFVAATRLLEAKVKAAAKPAAKTTKKDG